MSFRICRDSPVFKKLKEEHQNESNRMSER